MKRGFTLIELLAVIVILAIISLIAVPIVINIINGSKYESQKRSIDHYAEALKQSAADYQLKSNKKVEGKFNTTDGKTLTREDITLNVDYKGNVVCNRIVVNKDGSIYLSECIVDGDKVYISKDESKKENPSYYEYGKTEYGMIMENKSHSNKFLNTGIIGHKIYQFKISNTLDIEDKEQYESSDCSYNKDGSVICYWKQLEEKPGYYNMILASDGEMYTPVDSSYLFYYLGYQSIDTNFSVAGLNTSKTTNMSYMFYYTASSARSLNLGDKFDTSNVTNMSYMFSNSFTRTPSYGGFSFTFPDCFDTSKVTNMSHMFDFGFYGSNLDLGNSFDTSNVTDMSYMFNSDFYMTNLNLGNKFDTSKVTNMSHMFDGIGEHVMKSLSLGDKFDTSNVTDMSYMFYNTGRHYMINLDLGNKFDTKNVTNMSGMFNCTGLDKMTSLNLGDKFDTSNVTNMTEMFSGLPNLKTLDLGNKFDTSNVTNMNNMFWGFGQDMENFSLGDKFDTSNVTSMGGMFRGAFKNKLKKLDLGDNFNTSKVMYMDSMFNEMGYENLEELDLGNKFDTSSVKSMDSMFKNIGYKKLKKLDLKDKFVRGNKYNYYEYRFDNMFEGAGHESMTELNLHNFQFYRTYDYYRDNIFKDCGSEGVLNKIIVSNNELKGWLKQLISPKDVPDFWKASDGAIIQIQAP